LSSVALALAVVSIVSGTQANAPLPDATRFLAEARKRLASNELLQSAYTFRERVTEMRLNPFGQIGTGPVEVYDVYPIAPGELEYHRLIERGGVPVSATELREQDRQFLARYEQWRSAAGREGRTEREARLKRLALTREKNQREAQEASDLFEFALERREVMDGQPVIVVSFKPRPNVRPRSREGRMASNFAGFAWVHEHEYEVMRVEAEAMNDTIFGWGLIAKLHKGAKALFTRRKFSGDWLPVETRVSGTGRAMLFRKVSINYLRECSNYRRFDLSQLAALVDGARGSK